MMAQTPDFALASQSPRRLEILQDIGFQPDLVIPQDIPEIPVKGELPRIFVTRIATEKLQAAIKEYPNHIILAADTIVACGRRIIQKSETPEQQRQVLNLLSGRRNRVLTAVAVYDPRASHQKGHPVIRARYSDTHVSFKRLSSREIEGYIASDAWRGCAGYGGRGLALTFIKSINGNFQAAQGLPPLESRLLLESAGLRSALCP